METVGGRPAELSKSSGSGSFASILIRTGPNSFPPAALGDACMIGSAGARLAIESIYGDSAGLHLNYHVGEAGGAG